MKNITILAKDTKIRFIALIQNGNVVTWVQIVKAIWRNVLPQLYLVTS